MTAPTSRTQVGSATVIVRALTTQVKKDILKGIRDGWKTAEKEAYGYGYRAGLKWGRGFKAGVRQSLSGDMLNGHFNDLNRNADVAGRSAGRSYADAYAREVRDRLRQSRADAERDQDIAPRPPRSTSSGNNSNNNNGSGSSGGSNNSNNNNARPGNNNNSGGSGGGGNGGGGNGSGGGGGNPGQPRDERGRFTSIRRRVIFDLDDKAVRAGLKFMMFSLKAIAVLSAAAMAALAGRAALASITMLASALSGLAGLLAMMPSLMVGFLAPIAAIAVGMQGITGAFQAGIEMSKNAGKEAAEKGKAIAQAEKQVESANRAVEDAEKGVERATRRTQQARDKLNESYEEAAENMEDLTLAAKGMALDEEDALIAVARAEERLREVNSSSDSSALDRREAINDLKQQRLALERVRESNGDLAVEYDDAMKKGIEGSDAVTAAKENLSDAQEAELEAQQSLTDAIAAQTEAQQALTETMNQSLASVEAYNEAMAKLSPNAQDTVTKILGLKDAWKAMRMAVQDKLFAGIGDEVVMLANAQLPMLQNKLAGVAGAVNGVFRDIIGSFRAPDAVEKFGIVLERIRNAIEIARPGIMALMGVFKNLVTVGSEFFSRMAVSFTESAKNAETWSMNFDHVRSVIEGGIQTWLVFWGVLKNVAGIFGAIFQAGNESGMAMMRGMNDALAGFKNSLLSIEGQNSLSEFFTTGAEAMRAIGPIIEHLFFAFVNLGTILADLGTKMAPGVTDFLIGLRGGIDNLRPLVDTLGPKLSELFTALGAAMPQLGRTLEALVSAFSPYIDLMRIFAETLLPPLLRLLEDLAPTIASMAPIIFGAAVAWKAYNAYLVITNALQKTAIGQWILQRVTLIASTAATWAAAAGTWALNAAMAVLTSPITLVVAAIAALVAGIVLLYKNNEGFRNFVNSAWESIKNTFTVVMATIMPLVRSFTAWIKMEAIPWIMNLWHNYLVPAFEIIGEVIKAWWENYAKPAFNFFVDAIKWIADIVGWWWEHVLKPIFGLVGDVIKIWWEEVVKPSFNNFIQQIKDLADVISWWWKNIVEPAWKAVSEAIKWAWENIIQPVFRGFQDTLTQLGNFFENTVKGIETAWNKLKDIVKVPVAFVVNTIYNDGLAKAWNNVADIIGLGDLKLPKIEGFATGGYVSGPGGPTSDSIPARLSNGEYVLPANAVRRVGRENLDRFIKGSKPSEGMFVPPGFAEGGAVSDAIDKAKRFMQGESGKPYQYGGVGNPSWDCSGLWSGIVNVLQGRSATSGRQFNTESNFDSMGWVKGLSGAITVGIMRGGGGANSHMGGTIDGVNAESSGDYGVQWGGPARGSDHPMFPIHYTLPDYGGTFASGGSGGGFLDRAGNFIGGIIQTIRDKVADLFEKPVRAIGDRIPDFGPSALGQMPRKMFDSLSQKAIDFVRGRAEDKDREGASTGGAETNWNSSAGAEQWRPTVLEALARTGQSPADADRTVKQIDIESSGNPNAVNNYDINAQRGDPSVGLLQIINSTFQAWRDQSLPNDRRHPLANITAGIRYAVGEYGSLANIWPKRMGYDNGGMLKPGLTLVDNQTGSPEPVLNPGQWNVLKQGLNWEGANKWAAEQNFGKQFEDWGVDALKELVGQFTEPVGLNSLSDKGIDEIRRVASEAAAQAAAQATANANGGKLADTLVLQGPDPQHMMQTLNEEQKKRIAYTSRYTNG